MNINRQKLFWHRSIYIYWNWLQQLMRTMPLASNQFRLAISFDELFVYSLRRQFSFGSFEVALVSGGFFSKQTRHTRKAFLIYIYFLWAHNQKGNEQYWVWRIVSYIEIDWIPVERMNWTGRPFRRIAPFRCVLRWIFEIEQMPTNAEWYEFQM